MKGLRAKTQTQDILIILENSAKTKYYEFIQEKSIGIIIYELHN